MGKVVKLFKKEFSDFEGYEDFGQKVVGILMHLLDGENLFAIGIETQEETMLAFGFLFHDFEGMINIKYEVEKVQAVNDVNVFAEDLVKEIISIRRSDEFIKEVEGK